MVPKRVHCRPEPHGQGPLRLTMRPKAGGSSRSYRGLVCRVDILPDLPGPGPGIQISCELRKQARRHPVEFVLGLFRQLRPTVTEIVCGASGELPVRAGCAEAMPRSPEASVTETTDGLDNPVPPKPTRRPLRQDCPALRDVRRQQVRSRMHRFATRANACADQRWTSAPSRAGTFTWRAAGLLLRRRCGPVRAADAPPATRPLSAAADPARGVCTVIAEGLRYIAT